MDQQAARLLTEQDVAAILKVSPATLRSWRCRHQGPRFYKVGAKAIRYLYQDVLDFADIPFSLLRSREW